MGALLKECIKTKSSGSSNPFPKIVFVPFKDAMEQHLFVGNSPITILS
jgi:hypothetical protein